MTTYLYIQSGFIITAIALMLCHRFEVLGFKVAFLGFAVCLLCVFLAACIAMGQAIFGSIKSNTLTLCSVLLLGVLPLVGIVSVVGKKGLSVPPIHNVTTNIINPPAFDKAYTLRTDAENTLDPLTGDALAKHQDFYSDLKTKVTTLNKQEAFNRALKQARSLGWVIYHTQPSEGMFEAYDQTAFFGFKDDIVVRVTERPDGSALDIRSVSRVGKSDLGANAKRIEQFMAVFD